MRTYIDCPARNGLGLIKYTKARANETIKKSDGRYSDLLMHLIICQKVVRFLVMLRFTYCSKPSPDKSISFDINAKMEKLLFRYC